MIIPYGKHKIDNKDIKNVQKSLKSQFIAQGPLVGKFEFNLKRKVKSKYCVAVNSATSALHISCLALGINHKNLVWTVPNTFVSTSNLEIFQPGGSKSVETPPMSPSLIKPNRFS